MLYTNTDFRLIQMEFTASVTHGPLSVEIVAEEGEDYQQEILNLLEFIEENEEHFNALNVAPPDIEETPTEGEQSDLSSEVWSNSESEKQPDKAADQTDEVSEPPVVEVLEPVARKTGISGDQLSEFLYADPKGEEPPELLIDDLEVFGNTKVEKQRSGALILLYLWKQCYGVEEVNSSKLKDALTGSGIEPSSLFNAYNKHFKKSGGNNRIISLSRSGELEAVEEIKGLVGSDGK